MTALRRYGRRLFLTDLGKGTIAVAAIGIGFACSDDDPQPAATSTAPPAVATEQTPPDATPAPATATTAATAAPAGTVAPTTAIAELAAVDWHRVVLGNVSAYALVRSGEAAIVDTGTSGSAGSIEAALAAVGLGWDAVGHVIVTHSHGDHIGSLPDVLGRAPDATPYAGAGDIARIASPRPLVSVGDGDRVFGLDVIETPGHTPGHISLIDPAGGLLLAGDALNGSGSGIAGPNPRFTPDMAQANESLRKLATHSFETAVFGHGDPVEVNASALVATLAAGL